MTIEVKLLDKNQPIIIAIDGVSASGKGTLAKLMAKRFGLVYCQTSLFYRQLALNAVKAGIKDFPEAIIELSKEPLELIETPELYSPEVTEVASIVAVLPEVRYNLEKPQREFLAQHPRVVMEGRDIGSVIAPNADLKLFVTADAKIRAERRHKQMLENGVDVRVEEVLEALEERDKRDSSREAAPLMRAEDAIEIDTSNSSPEEIIEFIMGHTPSLRA